MPLSISRSILIITMFSTLLLAVADSVPSERTASTHLTDVSYIEADLNPHNISSKVRFQYNGTFMLTTGQSQIIVPSLINTGEPTLDPHTEIHLDILSNKGSSSSLLVSILWPTNKIGSTLEQWLYNYDDSGSFTLLWSLADEFPAVESSKVNDHTLELAIPDYGGFTQRFALKDDDLVRLLSTSSTPNPLTQNDLISIGTPTAYNISNNSIDYTTKWVVKRLINLQSPPYSVGNLYTLFQTQNSIVVDDRAMFTSYANPTESEIIDLLLLENTHLPTDKSQLLSTITDRTSADPQIIINVLQQMVEAGFLHNEGDLYSFF